MCFRCVSVPYCVYKVAADVLKIFTILSLDRVFWDQWGLESALQAVTFSNYPVPPKES